MKKRIALQIIAKREIRFHFRDKKKKKEEEEKEEKI